MNIFDEVRIRRVDRLCMHIDEQSVHEDVDSHRVCSHVHVNNASHSRDVQCYESSPYLPRLTIRSKNATG
jgi:hypothetical protein